MAEPAVVEVTTGDLGGTLAACAHAIVATPDLADKTRRARLTAKAWLSGRLSLGPVSTAPPMPDRPGRPPRPELLAPGRMASRGAGSREGRIALLHALAHIELNAVDMMWDIVGRFIGSDVPRAFFDDFVHGVIADPKEVRLHWSFLRTFAMQLARCSPRKLRKVGLKKNSKMSPTY